MNTEDPTNKFYKKSEFFGNPGHEFCSSDLLYENDSLIRSGIQTTAIHARYRQWPVGSTLKIFFINGNADERKQALEALAVWGVQVSGLPIPSNAIDLYAEEVTDRNQSNVRFQFIGGGGSAYVGRSDLFPVSVITIKSSIYSAPHEWGHVLARKHEHQSGEDPIPWDREYVYEYMAKRGWSKRTVDHNILNVINNDGKNEVDPERDLTSCMHYRFPTNWVLPEGRDKLPTGTHRWPSVRDKQKAQDVYPLDETPSYTPSYVPSYDPVYEETQYAPTYGPVYSPDYGPIYSPDYAPSYVPNYSPNTDYVPSYSPTHLEECSNGVKLLYASRVLLTSRTTVYRLNKNQLRILLSEIWNIDGGRMNHRQLTDIVWRKLIQG